MKTINKATFFLLLMPLLLAGGCAETNEAVVSGTVTVDDEPAETGSIAFIPADGKGVTAGAPITNGEYTARVPIGTMKVKINVPKVVGERRAYDTPDSPVTPLMEESLPAKYNDRTELAIDVKPGNNRQDYELESKSL